MIELKLYVVGRTPKSQRIAEDLEMIMEKNFKDQYSINVIDVLENPELAEGDKVFATPTILRTLPAPTKKVIGGLRNAETVLQGLNLTPGMNFL